jgi:proteasome lid subunit RPN8/RPN11
MTEWLDVKNKEAVPSVNLCDLEQVKAGEWPQLRCPVSGGDDFSVRVVIARSVLEEIHCHGKSFPNVEVCGLLVGKIYQDELGAFLYVQKMIRGEYASSQVAQVTFTPETWEHLYTTLDRDYPDLRILGWYHTHPRFGIFLSEADLFIHHNFFNTPEQIALVYDPHSGEQGVFIWKEGKTVVETCLIEEDVEASNRMPLLNPSDQKVAAVTEKIEKRLRNLEHRSFWMFTGLLALGFLTITYISISLYLPESLSLYQSSLPVERNQTPSSLVLPKTTSSLSTMPKEISELEKPMGHVDKPVQATPKNDQDDLGVEKQNRREGSQSDN